MSIVKLNKAWIPNSITMGNLLFGFLSIIFASSGHYERAGMCILFAALLDGFDGQVARMLGVSSKIGAELDSLADCVAFGIAPGFLAYSAYFRKIAININLEQHIVLGMFIAAIFPLCAAYRLARFNVSHESNSFSGLPSPIAGIIIALIPISFSETDYIQRFLPVFAVFFVLVALLMVSTVKFSKPQASVLKKIHGVKLILLILIVIGMSILLKKWILFIFIGLIVIYIFSGLYSFLIQLIQDRKY
ncbi:MAG TPA: CDP-diacylglycerol--serine O-phosphatidyltransferase [Spirochaetota bacterium]|jgi:CDP-diacylglycerol--serine O-phosphatidyltransferase|nr:CDP-diacylglycerol--serine O-phosphatidyltransferase [Spirochaetota bacterium]HQQ23962.1 CDP-diacylglycerol--serine O-phosphatidyltransferase [Spirochaetota bacterium]